MRMRNNATPTGEPLRRWIVSGSPVENMEETKEPRSEERNWIVRRRMIGRRRRPTGLRSSEMASVMPSPCSPTRNGTTTTMATTTASRTPCGALPPWPPCLSSIIFWLFNSFSFRVFFFFSFLFWFRDAMKLALKIASLDAFVYAYKNIFLPLGQHNNKSFYKYNKCWIIQSSFLSVVLSKKKTLFLWTPIYVVCLLVGEKWSLEG